MGCAPELLCHRHHEPSGHVLPHQLQGRHVHRTCTRCAGKQGTGVSLRDTTDMASRPCPFQLQWRNPNFIALSDYSRSLSTLGIAGTLGPGVPTTLALITMASELAPAPAAAPAPAPAPLASPTAALGVPGGMDIEHAIDVSPGELAGGCCKARTHGRGTYSTAVRTQTQAPAAVTASVHREQTPKQGCRALCSLGHRVDNEHQLRLD